MYVKCELFMFMCVLIANCNARISSKESDLWDGVRLCNTMGPNHRFRRIRQAQSMFAISGIVPILMSVRN